MVSSWLKIDTQCPKEAVRGIETVKNVKETEKIDFAETVATRNSTRHATSTKINKTSFESIAAVLNICWRRSQELKRGGQHHRASCQRRRRELSPGVVDIIAKLTAAQDKQGTTQLQVLHQVKVIKVQHQVKVRHQGEVPHQGEVLHQVQVRLQAKVRFEFRWKFLCSSQPTGLTATAEALPDFSFVSRQLNNLVRHQRHRCLFDHQRQCCLFDLHWHWCLFAGNKSS